MSKPRVVNYRCKAFAGAPTADHHFRVSGKSIKVWCKDTGVYVDANCLTPAAVSKIHQLAQVKNEGS